VASGWQRFSWFCAGGAGSDSRPVFLYWALHLELVDMTKDEALKLALEALEEYH